MSLLQYGSEKSRLTSKSLKNKRNKITSTEYECVCAGLEETKMFSIHSDDSSEAVHLISTAKV